MNVDFTYDLRLSASVVLLCNALEIMGHRRSTPQKTLYSQCFSKLLSGLLRLSPQG